MGISELTGWLFDVYPHHHDGLVVWFIGEEGQRIASVLRTLAIELGRRQDVTAPNLASLMLLVEENGKRLLLTGDGHAEDLINGLEKRGKLDPNKRLHLDVIKANITAPEIISQKIF